MKEDGSGLKERPVRGNKLFSDFLILSSASSIEQSAYTIQISQRSVYAAQCRSLRE
jgi:hypothetical protein